MPDDMTTKAGEGKPVPAAPQTGAAALRPAATTPGGRPEPRTTATADGPPGPGAAPAAQDLGMLIAENSFTSAPKRDPELVRRILEDPRMHEHRDGFQSCIQCGICTSGCPAARFTEYSPREIARRGLEGDESLLTDDSLWYCYYCYTCQSRCPRHNSVAVINQVVRGLQVEMGTGRRHVEMFGQWCANFYDKGMGGNPHLLFPHVSDAWGEKWVAFMDRLLEVREKLDLGALYPPQTVVAEVQTIMDETGFGDRLAAVRGEGPSADGGDSIPAPR